MHMKVLCITLFQIFHDARHMQIACKHLGDAHVYVVVAYVVVFPNVIFDDVRVLYMN